MAASTQWRIRCMGAKVGTATVASVGFGNVEMASSPGGVDLCDPAEAVERAAASTTYYDPPGINNYAPSMAFDNSSATVWWGGGRANHWIGWTFDDPVDIVEVRLKPVGSTSSETMTFFAVEYNDGSNWQIAWICYTASWTLDTEQTFTKPTIGALTAARYWAVNAPSIGAGGVALHSGGAATAMAEIVNLEMALTPGGADQCSGGTPLAASWHTDGITSYPASNAFDTHDGANTGQITAWYTGPSAGETMLGYDFGTTKLIQELRLRRFGENVEGSPGTLRVLKSQDGKNWLIHSVAQLEDDDYSNDGNYYNTQTATLSAASDLARTLAEGASFGSAADALIVAVGAGMARIYADRVMESTTTTGTGNLTLTGAVTGFQAFNAACVVADTFDYALYAVDSFGRPTGEWETGRGTYTGTDTIERTTVQESSNGDALVDFAAGTKHIILSHNSKSVKPWTAGFGFTTALTTSEVAFLYTFAEPVTFADEFAGSRGTVGTNPASSFVLTVQKNGSSVGTITISTAGVFTFATTGAEVAFAAGDVMKIVGPATAGTAANVAVTLKGNRS